MKIQIDVLHYYGVFDKQTFFYRVERQSYYKRRAEAEANPREFLSYIVDGMDQKKCDVPHYEGFADPKVLHINCLLRGEGWSTLVTPFKKIKCA